MQRWLLLMLATALSQPLTVWSEDEIKPDPQWKVARAQFTTQIENREPVDRVVLTRPPVDEMYFFTDLRHLEGRKVTHRWEFEGQLISVVPFEVAGPRWRVFSKKEIKPEQVGEWSVTVLDESGWPLHTEIFRYEAPQVPAGETPATAFEAPVETAPPIPATEAVPATEVPATEVPAADVPESSMSSPAVDSPPQAASPDSGGGALVDQSGSGTAASE